jgi:hypothetical protein
MSDNLDGNERRTYEHRFDRIEGKLDDLSTAMVSLARAEEKLISIEKQNYNHYERMNKFSEKLDELEDQTADNTRSISIINRISWTLIAAVITFAVSAAGKFL